MNEARADHVRADRVIDFERTDAAHVTFGNGPHVCPGALLARSEMCITVEEWLTRIPEFEVAPQAEVRFRGGLVGVVDALPLGGGDDQSLNAAVTFSERMRRRETSGKGANISLSSCI